MPAAANVINVRIEIPRRTTRVAVETGERGPQGATGPAGPPGDAGYPIVEGHYGGSAPSTTPDLPTIAIDLDGGADFKVWIFRNSVWTSLIG